MSVAENIAFKARVVMLKGAKERRMPLLNVSPYIELIATSITMEIISISQHEVEEC